MTSLIQPAKRVHLFCTRASITFRVNTSPPKPLDIANSKTSQVHRSHDAEGTGQCLWDLDPKSIRVKVKGQIMYFLVNASPKPLDIATSNFAGI